MKLITNPPAPSTVCPANPSQETTAMVSLSQAIRAWEADRYVPSRSASPMVVVQAPPKPAPQPAFFATLFQGLGSFFSAGAKLVLGGLSGFGLAVAAPSAAVDAWNGLRDAARGLQEIFNPPDA